MKIRDEYTCPLEIVHDIMKGKWKTIIIFQLKNGKTSLARLEHDIKGITQKMLLQHLRELKHWGIVGKINSDGYPLQVGYYLTGRGEKMLQAVKIMQEIGIDYMAERGQASLPEGKDSCCKK